MVKMRTIAESSPIPESSCELLRGQIHSQPHKPLNHPELEGHPSFSHNEPFICERLREVEGPENDFPSRGIKAAVCPENESCSAGMQASLVSKGRLCTDTERQFLEVQVGKTKTLSLSYLSNRAFPPDNPGKF